VDWGRLSINFIMIFSPGILSQAPQTGLAALKVPADQEDALEQAVTDRFANVSAIRVKEALAAVDHILTADERAGPTGGAGGRLAGLLGLVALAGSVTR